MISLGHVRQAIFDANNTLGPDTILFSADPNDGLNGATIELDNALPELTITEAVTVDASALSNKITIDAGKGADGVVYKLGGTVAAPDGKRALVIQLSVDGAANEQVTLRNLKITGNYSGSNERFSAYAPGQFPTIALAA